MDTLTAASSTAPPSPKTATFRDKFGGPRRFVDTACELPAGLTPQQSTRCPESHTPLSGRPCSTGVHKPETRCWPRLCIRARGVNDLALIHAQNGRRGPLLPARGPKPSLRNSQTHRSFPVTFKTVFLSRPKDRRPPPPPSCLGLQRRADAEVINLFSPFITCTTRPAPTPSWEVINHKLGGLAQAGSGGRPATPGWTASWKAFQRCLQKPFPTFNEGIFPSAFLWGWGEY